MTLRTTPIAARHRCGKLIAVFTLLLSCCGCPPRPPSQSEQRRAATSNWITVEAPVSDAQGTGRLNADDLEAITQTVPTISVAVAERVVTGILHSDATGVESEVRVCATTPEYLQVLDEGARVKVKQGRFVHSGDPDNAANIIVLSEKIAATLFAATDPVGQTIRLADKQLTVVGVVTDGAAWGTGLTYDAYVTLAWLTSDSEGTTPFPYDRFRFRVTSMNEMASTEKVVQAIVDRRHPDHNVRVRSFLSDSQ